MKTRFAWRWTLRTSDGTDWYGTCPVWASWPLPEGAVMTSERVKVIGERIPCNVPGCGGAHANLSKRSDS